MDQIPSPRILKSNIGTYRNTAKDCPVSNHDTGRFMPGPRQLVNMQPVAANNNLDCISRANLVFRPNPARDEAPPFIQHSRGVQVSTNGVKSASPSTVPSMPAAMRWAHPSRSHPYRSSHSSPAYRGRDTIPPIFISGTNEVVVTPPEESWHALRVLRPVGPEMFSSQPEEDSGRATEDVNKAPNSTGTDKAAFSTVRKSRPCNWTKVFSPSEVLLLAEMIEMKHLKNTDRKKLEKVLEGAIGTMLELLTELERSAVLPDLETVPRTYSSLVRAAIKLQIVIPSRYLILGNTDQTDNLMRACKEYILFLRKRAEEARAKRTAIKIGEDVIEISSDNSAAKAKARKSRKKSKHGSDAGENTILENPRKRKREVTEEEAGVTYEEQGVNEAVSKQESPTHWHGKRRVSDQALLQKHLQDTEEENSHLRALLEAHGVARSGITMGLLRIKNGYTADAAISGL